jgi:hypothetical protein
MDDKLMTCGNLTQNLATRKGSKKDFSYFSEKMMKKDISWQKSCLLTKRQLPSPDLALFSGKT